MIRRKMSNRLHALPGFGDAEFRKLVNKAERSAFRVFSVKEWRIAVIKAEHLKFGDGTSAVIVWDDWDEHGFYGFTSYDDEANMTKWDWEVVKVRSFGDVMDLVDEKDLTRPCKFWHSQDIEEHVNETGQGLVSMNIDDEEATVRDILVEMWEAGLFSSENEYIYDVVVLENEAGEAGINAVTIPVVF